MCAWLTTAGRSRLERRRWACRTTRPRDRCWPRSSPPRPSPPPLRSDSSPSSSPRTSYLSPRLAGAIYLSGRHTTLSHTGTRRPKSRASLCQSMVAGRPSKSSSSCGAARQLPSDSNTFSRFLDQVCLGVVCVIAWSTGRACPPSLSSSSWPCRCHGRRGCWCGGGGGDRRP